MKNIKNIKYLSGLLFCVSLLATGCNKTTSLDFVKLGTTSITLFNGESVFIPSSFTGTELTWKTSDNKVATVSDGIVKAKASGVSVITASSNKASSTCIVNVVGLNNKNSNISLSRNNATISQGDALQLAYQSDKEVKWKTSDIDVATVRNGLISAQGVGETIISATAGDYTVDCIVSVTESSAKSSNTSNYVSLSRSSAVMSVNDMLKLSYKSSNNITWGSTDTSVLTVSESGVITATGSGEATVTALCDGVSSSCAVTVIESKDETLENYMSLSRNELTLSEHSFMTLSYLASSIDVAWKSSDVKVATINSNGEISTLGSGKAVITATCDGVTDKCVVNVVKTQEVNTPSVSEDLVKLNRDSLSLNVGSKFALSCSATDSTVWSSSNDHIVTVDNYGIVEAILPGTAVITAKCGKASATCAVTVTEGVSSVTKNDFIDALKYSQPTRVITNTEFTYYFSETNKVTLTYSSILTIDYSDMIKTTYSYSYQTINDPSSGCEEMISTHTGVIYTEGTSVGEATDNGIAWNTSLEGSVTLLKFDYETLKTYGTITEDKQIYLTIDASKFSDMTILKGDDVSNNMNMTIFIQPIDDEYNIKAIDYQYDVKLDKDAETNGESAKVETSVRYYYD